jgi:hypothetical protein
MNDTRKDLPPVSSPNFLEKVREALSVYLGNRGDKLDRGVTLRDLTDSGLVVVNPAYRTGSGGASPIGGAGPNAGGSYEIDLTPPPIPSGFTATAAISNLLVECASQRYTQGNGHAKSVLYGATWSAGALPVFSDAVVLTEFSGTVASHATNPSTTWHLWLKWVTVDGVYSTSPAGGTNGVVTRTGEDVETLVAAMTGPGNPFTILATTTVFDGVTFPAGTYSSQAFIQDAQITNAKIANLAVDNAKIADLSVSAAKITDATITTTKIADAQITTALIGDAAITTAKIATAAITTALIGDAAITNAKIANLAVDTLNIKGEAVSTTRYNKFNYSPPIQPSTPTQISSFGVNFNQSGDYIIILNILRSFNITGFDIFSSSIYQDLEVLMDGVSIIRLFGSFSFVAIGISTGSQVLGISAGWHTFSIKYCLRMVGPGSLNGSGIISSSLYIYGAYK